MLDLVLFAQFPTQNRASLLLELLRTGSRRRGRANRPLGRRRRRRRALSRRTRLAEVAAPPAAAIADLPAFAALAPSIEHLQLAAELLQHHLRRVPVLAALVLPFPRLQLALDIDLHALLQVLLGHLGEVVVEDDDVVPLGLFLAVARILVAPALRGGDAQIDDRIAGVQPAHLGIGSQIAHQNDLVYAARHLVVSTPVRNRSARMPRHSTRSPLPGAPQAGSLSTTTLFRICSRSFCP